MPEVGDIVTYIDPHGRKYNALVTAVWPFEYGQDKKPGLNLVVVSQDESQRDDYGRQILRPCSVPHQESQAAPANYWA